MAKKFVRGITDVKTINNQDFDTNNVNDLLSDGQYNYIHRKKGKNEEYHNLTDNIKTLSSDNTDLLTVTNNNKTTNTATLHPKHDAQKEQVLESTRNTVNIQHGTNGTAEKTTVDTNPQKVLEHENLIAGSYLTKTSSGNTTTLKVSDDFVAIVNGKQNTLTPSGGLSLSGNTISLTVVDQYAEDLNNLTYTCLARPKQTALNLPAADQGGGVLSVIRIGFTVSQKYHTLQGDKLYIRMGRNIGTSPTWSNWTLLTYATN